jgi:prepilin-type processing-associated H-X9-DG protein/prepilin-type N-terminal cleavage/methylation domain-containing protein
MNTSNAKNIARRFLALPTHLLCRNSVAIPSLLPCRFAVSIPYAPNKRRHSAFTLVEMLVVIVILSILLALIFPVATASKRAANNAVCVGNLKQIGIGLLTYATDHDGRLIPGACLNDAETYNWYHLLNQECMGGNPANKDIPTWLKCPSKTLPTNPKLPIGYGWNFWSGTYTDTLADGGFGYKPNLGELGGFGYNSRLADVTRPSHTIIVGDSRDLEAPPQQWSHMFLYPPRGQYAAVRYRASRHNGKGNYLMVDGHVEALPPTMDGSYFQKKQ